MFEKEAISLVLEFIGTMIIGLTILRVHLRLSYEHKIDKFVIEDIKKEKTITIIGLILITLGFVVNFI